MDAKPPHIGGIRARALQVPVETDRECDGTLCWDATGLVLVEIEAGGVTGLGYSYTEGSAAATLIKDKLAGAVTGADPMDLPALWQRMNAALRNVGRPGLGLMALAAVDIALWDLKARLLKVPLPQLWGRAREAVPVYGSGGFTNYSPERLRDQLAGWVEAGMLAVKLKVGSHPAQDPERVRQARDAVGPSTALMVDGNGAYDRVQALQLAQRFAAQGVCWFEEPVSSDDLEGLCWLRQRMPSGMSVAAGEYGWDARYFRAMLDAEAVDVLQADATRCGFTGFLQAATLCDAFQRPLSAHCAPALHAQVGTAAVKLRNLEYFHDHVRIEQLLFDGLPELREGALWPRRDAPGHGLTLKASEVERYER
jgi:L-alanine-DL-glutamate epimerase-like enolase superfamily enzyme